MVSVVRRRRSEKVDPSSQSSHPHLNYKPHGQGGRTFSINVMGAQLSRND
jgi:hypothetical protein